MSRDPRELQTERLILRPFRLDDADDVFACANDDEWDRYFYTAVPHPFGRRDAEEYVAGRLLAPWDENPTFAIVLDGTVIGGIEVHVDAQNQVAEVGYSVARRHWGKGLTEEAVSAVIDYASGAFGFARVYTAADAHLGSWRVWRRSA